MVKLSRSLILDEREVDRIYEESAPAPVQVVWKDMAESENVSGGMKPAIPDRDVDVDTSDVDGNDEVGSVDIRKDDASDAEQRQVAVRAPAERPPAVSDVMVFHPSVAARECRHSSRAIGSNLVGPSQHARLIHDSEPTSVEMETRGVAPYHPHVDHVQDEGSVQVAKRSRMADEDEYSFLPWNEGNGHGSGIMPRRQTR